MIRSVIKIIKQMIIIIFISGYFYLKYQDKKNLYDSEVKADSIDANCLVDSDGSTTCQPVYYYTIRGQIYSCKARFSSSHFDERKDKVFYSKGNPKLCLTEFELGSNLYILIGFCVGSLLTLIGLIMILRNVVKSLKINKLIKYGTLFKGVKYKIENSNISVSGSPLIIPHVELQIPNGETLHLIGTPLVSNRFRSTNNTVDVLIDLNDPKVYYIDYEIRVSGDVTNKMVNDLKKKFIFKIIDYRLKKEGIIEEKKNLIDETIKNDGSII